uniref:FA complementation group M n=1 Tax=Gasterosteus aculeatus aculeatus TaxID=481459 RepID=G3P4E5_GASAC|nr:Fanconi anemia group M protein isoform X1 [Gasterosteus aculeatus aculeatus]
MSSGSNQRTLFQTWGGPVSQNKAFPPKKEVKKAAGRRRANVAPSNGAQVANVTTRLPSLPPNPLWPQIGHGARTEDPPPLYEYDDDDDDLMVVAVSEAEKCLQLNDANYFRNDARVSTESAALGPSASPGRTYPDLPGFDGSSAKVWIYPTNYPIREYQVKISEAALFRNTLVCLPTGLGKTFIAAVVMYNFYRWYPSGKIVFMAPTKPLVAQQIEACYKVMGIPQAHMAELTGTTAANRREDVWRTKRVFFLTPQVMANDLSRDTCPAQQVKCVVIDEAHKALGNHAYCQVIRQLCSQTLQFRILALSATPGGDTKSVQSVISNLLVSHIELRSEESPDIQAHSHERSVDKMVVPLGESLSAHQARYLQVLEKFMSRLVQNRVMARKDLRTLSKYQIILARDQFRKNPPSGIKGPQQGMLEGDFALCISLYHGYELLMQMGLRSLFFYVQGIMEGSREMPRARNELQRTPVFVDLYHEMQAMFVKPSAGPDEPFIYSHPKLKKLEEVVLQHFRRWAESSEDSNGPQEVSTRVMIFSSFRESVQEIADMLNHHAPLIRVMTFMGQASTGKAVKGFTQKEQLEVVCRFRRGGFNTLVSTCVGEEGLDIGEVDLIVCFDAQKNPTRLVQRMGRTGRKRRGRIVVILAEGREERTYNQSQSNKRSIHKSIIGNKISFHMYPNSPRMLPEGVNPTMHKMHITCGQFDHQESGRRSVRGRRSHSEGRASLIHPQNLIRQGSTKSDGFLTSAEYSLWASTMRLEEDEAHPTLKPSRFMCLPDDASPQEDVSRSGPPSRDLSLWEWRHWQHKALPTHDVDHSLRCHHFVKVMELVDVMREENEGECRYEQELLPYRHKAGAVFHGKKGQKKSKGTKTCTKSARTIAEPPPSAFSDAEYLDADEEEEADLGQTRGRSTGFTSTVATQGLPVADHTAASWDDITGHPGPEAICPLPSNNDRPEAGVDDDRVFINQDAIKSDQAVGDRTSQLITKIDDDEGVELQAMFYLPECDPGPPSFAKLPAADPSLKVILANVAELLSRSPPPTLDLAADMAPASLPPSPPHQPFQVTFALDVDDEDDEVMMIDDVAPRPDGEEDGELYSLRPRREQRRSGGTGSAAASSPTWEEVFGEEETNDDGDVRDIAMETDNDLLEEDEGVGGDAEKFMEINIGNDGATSLGDGRQEEMADSTRGVEDARRAQMDASMDLFGDDEVFLQITIPDISTPGAASRTPPTTGDVANRRMANASHTLTPAISCHADESSRPNHRTPSPRAQLTETKPSAAPSRSEPGASETGEGIAAQRETVERSHVYYSVNFDLGYSLEDSDEAEEEAAAPCSPTSPQHREPAGSAAPRPAAPGSSTPCYGFRGHRKPLLSTTSTPDGLSLRRGGGTSPLPASAAVPGGGALPSPIASAGSRRTLVPSGPAAPSLGVGLKRKRLENRFPPRPDSFLVECSSDSEEDVAVRKTRHQNRVKPFSSPDVSKTSSDVDSPSPVVVKKKRAAALNTTEETEAEAVSVSDDDFQDEFGFTRRTAAHVAERKSAQQGNAKYPACRKGHQFLDVEAEMSEDGGADVSSDEEDGEEQNRSLEGFVVDNTHLSQGLDDSEMHGVYLKSVKSPALQGRFKMSYKNRHNMDIFSQVPEVDESYAEDSFVVGSEVESSEGEAEDVELMPEESFVEGRRQYATRRRVFLRRARAGTGGAITTGAPPERSAEAKTKRLRVIRLDDSSEEEETGEVGKKAGLGKEAAADVPLRQKAVQTEPSGLQQQKPSSCSSSTIASKFSSLSKTQRCSVSEEQQEERWRQRLDDQHLLSDELDFREGRAEVLSSKKEPQIPAPPATSSAPQTSAAQDSPVGRPAAPPAPVCILVDSRCIGNGAELISSLRRSAGATVHVCSLDGGYFIVSGRMAAERHSQSDLAAMQNRKRLAERVNGLLGSFERVCLIVEKDRTKPGEASRPPQRTRCYDSTLTALVRAGARLLWSDGAEQTAGLLVELARLEQRKGQGITVPLEVKGQHRQQALQLYLSLPSVNYVHALSMSHNFRSIGHLVNSSVEAIEKGGCMSRARAEEIYRFLRYSCDSVFMNTSKAGKTS